MANKRKYDSQTDLIAIRIPRETHEALKRQADRTGQTKSEVAVRAMGAGLPQTAEEPETIFD
jgi:predicted DNA-binding protein